MFYFFPCPRVLSSLPLRGPYCITVPVILVYMQSLPGLRRRLNLVAEIVISCSIAVVLLQSRVFLTTSERTYLFGLHFPFPQRLRDQQQFSEDIWFSRLLDIPTFFEALMSNIFARYLINYFFALEKDLEFSVFQTRVWQDKILWSQSSPSELAGLDFAIVYSIKLKKPTKISFVIWAQGRKKMMVFILTHPFWSVTEDYVYQDRLHSTQCFLFLTIVLT